MIDPELQARAIEYAKLCAITLDLRRPLGYGNDGAVWKSNRQTAVKAFERQDNYDRESKCYQRLAEQGVTRIQGLAVPQLIDLNASLKIVEMRIVTPPFLLDFGKAYLDRPADYSEEAMNDWEEIAQELFGARWGDVKGILWELRQYGIYYYDAKPGNISFADDDLEE